MAHKTIMDTILIEVIPTLVWVHLRYQWMTATNILVCTNFSW